MGKNEYKKIVTGIALSVSMICGTACNGYNTTIKT